MFIKFEVQTLFLEFQESPYCFDNFSTYFRFYTVRLPQTHTWPTLYTLGRWTRLCVRVALGLHRHQTDHDDRARRTLVVYGLQTQIPFCRQSFYDDQSTESQSMLRFRTESGWSGATVLGENARSCRGLHCASPQRPSSCAGDDDIPDCMLMMEPSEAASCCCPRHFADSEARVGDKRDSSNGGSDAA